MTVDFAYEAFRLSVCVGGTNILGASWLCFGVLVQGETCSLYRKNSFFPSKRLILFLCEKNMLLFHKDNFFLYTTKLRSLCRETYSPSTRRTPLLPQGSMCRHNNTRDLMATNMPPLFAHPLEVLFGCKLDSLYLPVCTV